MMSIEIVTYLKPANRHRVIAILVIGHRRGQADENACPVVHGRCFAAFANTHILAGEAFDSWMIVL